ncbi:MAG: arginase family protein [Candidatus Omnitrophica bacterium]|nr:arginase family protein [Candidatus Omnitrophota bacterium]MDD5652940.1 arginase family protein [Candidatus Omnitrophota bacterium]
MLGDRIRVLDLDGSILEQKKLLGQYKCDIVALREFGPQARHFTSRQTRDLLADRLFDTPKESITFLGSGDFHHISEILISRFEEPLTVIMFDHHPDWDSRPPRYGCGSWVTEVLKSRPNVKKFILLGVSSEDISSFNINGAYLEALKDNRLEIYPYTHKPSKTFGKDVPDNASLKIEKNFLFNTIFWQELKGKNLENFFRSLLKRIPTKDVYVSLDKDCLTNDYALTNWEEGNFSLEEVLSLLGLIKDNFNIAGFDITGEYSPILVKGILKRIASYFDHPKKIKALSLPGSQIRKVNEETNLKIMKTINA